MIDGNPSRVELPEIPRAAFREAVVNAFCHRDFTDYGTAVQVDIYPDAVDITNPGAFPLGRTPEMYLSEMVVAPRSRNPLIATTLFRSKVVEAFGSGIRRIRDTCEEAGVRFEYMQGPDATTLRFCRNDPYDVMHTGQSPAEAVQAHLSQGAAKALKILENEDGHTAASLAVELGISARQAQRVLKELRDARCIEREGSDKNGAWKVLRHPVS